MALLGKRLLLVLVRLGRGFLQGARCDGVVLVARRI